MTQQFILKEKEASIIRWNENGNQLYIGKKKKIF
jgi:hypothetical protein